MAAWLLYSLSLVVIFSGSDVRLHQLDLIDLHLV